MKNFNQTILAVAIAYTCSTVYVYAQEQSQPSSEAEQNPSITINVTDSKEDELSTKQVLDAEDIRNTPSSNGNLTDYLKDNPNVRFADTDQNGFTGGEIKPTDISINGADTNQTSYLLDGVNVNNDLDPTNEIFDGTMGVMPNRSSGQAYFFDANLLSGITVYTSGVPAKLGGFTGGAVLAETRQYSGEDRVKVNYRTTQSEWASMKVDENARSLLDGKAPLSGDAEFQPDYRKNFYSVLAEQSITDDFGVVLGFSRRDSNIAQNREVNPEGDIDQQSHSRRSDNFLANFNWTPSVDSSLEWGLRLSDYKEGKYFADNINGNVTDKHLAYGTTLKWSQTLGSGRLVTTAAYDKFSDERESSANSAVVTIDLSTGANYEQGGYGNSQMSQQNINLMVDYEFDRFKVANTSHVVSLGTAYRKTDYDFNRDDDVSQKTIMTMSGFELMNETKMTRQGSVSTSYQDFALYADDFIQWKAFTFRPGVRVERDDYLSNTNIAPRFTSTWQALSDTRFNLGLNRYYGRSFASMKLAGEVLKLNDDLTRRYETVDSLKTPFSDELQLGVDQNLGNFAISANYILREYKDRIVVRRDNTQSPKVDSYSNGDDYNVNVYTLQITNITPWAVGPTRWNASLGADWLNTKRSDLGRDTNPNDSVYLDGKLMTHAQMEKEVNSNTEEWVVRLGLDMQAPSTTLFGQISCTSKRQLVVTIIPWMRLMVFLCTKAMTLVRIHSGILEYVGSRQSWVPIVLTCKWMYLTYLTKSAKNKTSHPRAVSMAFTHQVESFG